VAEGRVLLGQRHLLEGERRAEQRHKRGLHAFAAPLVGDEDCRGAAGAMWGGCGRAPQPHASTRRAAQEHGMLCRRGTAQSPTSPHMHVQAVAPAALDSLVVRSLVMASMQR
jgi:hypothetical protein